MDSSGIPLRGREHVQIFFFFFFLFLSWKKWWNLLVEGLLSMGPTPSSFSRDKGGEGPVQGPSVACDVFSEVLHRRNRPCVAGTILENSLYLLSDS